ncbi:uncharacterized protein LOC112597103 [Melanaphis sacchari]|uniref:uncharacterized protein LOC112597103 n=1 Tax=Melanaphis sacchari TaxID=742174 RepID=UPI000DC14549|nr:uncharacterized protein LOC112597103 [Melanaphis sacchari]
MAQNSYISLTAHIINNEWLPKSFTLATQKMEEQHTAVNLAEKLTRILDDWEINGKVSTVITDNAKNVVNAVKLLLLTIDNENMDVTCAAHSLQLAISTALKDEIFSELIKQCSSLVGHFKHSNVAKQSLFKKQEHLGISSSVTDRTVTSLYIAQKLEITESQWLKIEILPLGASRRKIIDQQVLKMVVKKYYPFSIVEDREFVQFLNLLNPGYTLASRKTLLKSLLPIMYNEIHDKVKQDIKDHAKYVSNTTDSWTSIKNEN